MDVWEWVHRAESELRESGHTRLAQLMDEVSSACCDGHHDRVESIVPEALALARPLNHPWLEVFLRHWLLQSRVLHRHDVSRDTLAQAVSLIELTGRPEARECPQSVCAVQDLCSAYGLIDGVGYGEQRLAVTEEALARIDPRWPCFDCVSSERASALRDLGRHQEALDFCEAQLKRKPRNPSGIQADRFRCLSALGRHAEALLAANQVSVAYSGESGKVAKALYLCLSHVRAGDRAKALECLPDAEKLTPKSYLDWLRAVRELGIAEGEDGPNTWRIEQTLSDMHAGLSERSSHFTLAKLHKVAAELALQRGARYSVQQHVKLARGAGAQLLTQDWLLPKLEGIEQAMAALPAAPAASSLEALLEELGSDPEQDLARVVASPWADSPRLAVLRANALRALGAEPEALSVLERAFATAPGDTDLLRTILAVLLELGDHARLEQLAEQARGDAAPLAIWALARSHRRRDEQAQTRARCEELLAADPEHEGARHLLAMVLRDGGELEGALHHLDALVAANEPGSHDWDRMLVATLAQRWDALHDSARRLELPIESAQGAPIDEEWGGCRIRVRLADGSTKTYFAWRRGPVTARIDEVAGPDEEQHHADLVLFDAEPLNQAEIEEAKASGAKQMPLTEYAAYRVLVPGRFRAFAIDGFSPDKEQRAALTERLTALGIAWEQRSGTRYVLHYEGKKQPATYAFLGLPATCSDDEAHLLLKTAQAELGLRLTWPGLAQAAGDQAGESEHRRLADEWGIE